MIRMMFFVSRETKFLEDFLAANGRAGCTHQNTRLKMGLAAELEQHHSAPQDSTSTEQLHFCDPLSRQSPINNAFVSSLLMKSPLWLSPICCGRGRNATVASASALLAYHSSDSQYHLHSSRALAASC